MTTLGALARLQHFRQRGFTLLEAVIALALLAAVGGALVAWLQASLASEARVREAAVRAELTADALEWLRTINPMAEAAGVRETGRYQLSWRTVPESTPRESTRYPLGIGIWQVQLFNATVTISPMKSSLSGEVSTNFEPFDFAVKLTGWQQVRNPPRMPVL